MNHPHLPYREHYPETPGHRDRDTSARAAAAVAPTAQTVRADCLRCLATHGPQTADEVAARLCLSILTVRPRMTELTKLGATRDSGLRRANASGKRAIVWEILANAAAEGRAA